MGLGQWTIRHQGVKVFTFPHAVPEEIGNKFVKALDKEFGPRKKNEDDFLQIQFWLAHQWDLHCIEEEKKFDEEAEKLNLKRLKGGDVKFFFTDPITGEEKEIKPMKDDINEIHEMGFKKPTGPFGRIDNDPDKPKGWYDIQNEEDLVDWIMDRDMPHHLEEDEKNEEDD